MGIQTVTQAFTNENMGSFGFRNLVINGNMSIAQRNTSVSGASTSNYYCVDRFYHEFNTAGTYTISQSTDVPATSEFSNSLKMDCSATANNTSGSQYSILMYKIEGRDLQRLGYGKSSAKNLSLSFWVKSSVTGNTSVEFLQRNGTNRSICRTITINQANTWEYKTVTIPGDTSGNIPNDSAEGMVFHIFLVAGAYYSSGGTMNTASWAARDTTKIAPGVFNVGSSIGNTFYITGVQLEVGSVSTPFEHRPFGLEFQLCQRYFEKSFAYGTTPQHGLGPVNNGTIYALGAVAYGTGGSRTPTIRFSVPKRTYPAVTLYSPNSAQGGNADGNWTHFTGSSWVNTTGNGVVDGVTTENGFAVELTRVGALTFGYTYLSGGHWTASAEL